MRRPVVSRLLAIAVVALLAVSCANPSTATLSPGPSQKAFSGGTVTVRLAGDWGNPIDGGQTVTTATGGSIAEAMYDRLLSFDTKKTGKVVVPYLATSWDVTPSSVTFHLRNDVTCSDGAPVTPTVVYNSFARFIDPNTKSRWPPTIFGSGPYKIAKDDGTGTFTFSTPTPYNGLLYSFAMYWTGIICPKGLEPGADFTKQSYGSGPYVLKSATQGSEYVMTKREGWNWGPEGGKSSDNGFPETLVIKVVANDSTAANLLVTGGLDITTVAGPDITRLRGDATVDPKIDQGFAPYTLQMNETAGRPGADATVRKAVYTALDPNAWNKAAYDGQGVVSTNFQANPGLFCYTDLSSIMPKPSVTDAKKILTDAGWAPGSDGKLQKNGQTLGIKVVGTNFTGSGVEYIADTLNQVGIKVDLVNTDYTTFAQNFGALNYDLVVGLFGGSAPVASGTANFFRGDPPPKGNNRIVRDDAQLNALVDRAYGAPPEQACQAWKDFNSYMITNNIALPWVSPYTFWFSKKGVWSYATQGPTVMAEYIRKTQP